VVYAYLKKLLRLNRKFTTSHKFQNRLFASSVILIVIVILSLYILSRSLVTRMITQKQTDFELDSIKQVNSYVKSVFTDTEGYIDTLYKYLKARDTLTNDYDKTNLNFAIGTASDIASAVNLIILNKESIDSVIVLGRNNAGCIYRQRDAIMYDTESIDTDFEFNSFYQNFNMSKFGAISNLPFYYNANNSFSVESNSERQIHNAINNRIVLIKQMINEDGEVDGIAIIGFKESYISDIIPPSFDNSTMFFADVDNTVLWTNNTSEQSMAVYNELSLSSDSPKSFFNKMNGEEYLIINGVLEPYEFKIVTLIPVKSFIKNSKFMQIYSICFGLCCAVLAFFSSYLFSGNVCRQLNDLTRQLQCDPGTLPGKISLVNTGGIFSKLSLRSKIFFHFCLTAIIPTILFISFTTYFNYQTYKDKIIELTNNSVKQLKWNIDYKIKGYDNLSVSAIYDDDIQAAFDRQEYLSNKNQVKLKINEVFLNKKIKNNDILSFTLYDTNGEVLYSNIPFNTFPPTAISDNFYSLVNKGSGSLIYLNSNKDYLGLGPTLLFARPISGLKTRFGKRLGYLVFSVDQETIYSLTAQVSLGYSTNFFLADGRGDVIAGQPAYQDFKQILSKLIASGDNDVKDGFITMNYNNEDFMVFCTPLVIPEIKIAGIVPLKEVVSKVYPLIRYSLIIFAAYLFLIILLSVFISYGITKPLERLRKLMGEIKNENFNVRMNYKGKDEIAILSDSFNLMVDRLNQLIYENYQSRVHESELMFLEKESQLNALQQQINPHFLYNTLESIKWMAYKIDAIEICNMTTALGKFFRGTIAKGSDFITVRQEVEHLESYIYIQKIRYKGKLDVVVDIDDEVIEYKVIKLILQPIVENAIIHGLDKIKSGGIISISCKKTEESLCFEVNDNGVGMSDEALKALKERIVSGNSTGDDRSGIGLSNVYRRLKLYFGDKSSFEVMSEVDRGTSVKISIPLLQ